MLHLVLDSQRHPRLAARPGHDRLVGRRSSVREEHIGLIDEGVPGNSFVVREPVPSWERDDQALQQQALAHQRVARDRRPKNPDMDRPVLQGGNLLRSREIAQLHLDIGMSPSEEPDNSRTVEEVSPQGAAHDQLADLTAARPLHGPGGLLGLRDDRSSLSEEHSARVRQLDATRRPMEEGSLQLLLEAPNLLAQGRLRDMESRSRPSKMKFFGDREEVAQVAQLHTGNSYHQRLNSAWEIYWTLDSSDRIVSQTPHCRTRGSEGENMPLFRVPSTNISARSPTTRRRLRPTHATTGLRGTNGLHVGSDRLLSSIQVGLSRSLVSKEDSMRIASGLTTTVALLMGSTVGSWAQGPGSAGSTSPSPAASGSSASTILALGFLAVIVIAIVVVARYVVTRRKRNEEAVILQSQLSDALAREAQLSGLHITPRAQVSGWRRSQVTIEVAGEVPTPELRGTVMQIATAEARRLQPDVIAVDHLFIVPPVRRA